MGLHEILIALGAVAVSLTSIGVIVRYLLKAEFKGLNSDLEKDRQKEEVARTSRDAQVDQKFALLDRELLHLTSGLIEESSGLFDIEIDILPRKPARRRIGPEKRLSLTLTKCEAEQLAYRILQTVNRSH